MYNTLGFHNSTWVILQMTITRYLTNINVLLIFYLASSVVVLCTKLFPLTKNFLSLWLDYDLTHAIISKLHNDKHFYYKKSQLQPFLSSSDIQ